MSTNKINLRVAEARARDVGRGIARIDSKSQESLRLSSGEIIEINGMKTSAGIVWPAYPQDEGLGIIRIDGTIRRNTGVSLEDTVTIKKADVRRCVRINIAPTVTIRFGSDFNDYVKRHIEGKPLTRGDTVTVPVLGEALQMVVISTQPAQIVVVDRNTQIVIRNEPVTQEAGISLITYEDVGGLKDELQRIREIIELPMKHPELFRHIGIEPPKGVLLYGPPGTGKTLIAKAVANETGSNFITINGPEIMSKFYGESEQRLRQLFEEGEKNAPSIIFIDEMDALAPKREEVTGEVEKRVVSQLLTLMDGLKSRGQVIVIGATNRIDAVDPALRRPGRFDREISLGVPDKSGRMEILQIHIRNMPIAEGVNLDELASITHGFVGADIAQLARESAMNALRKFLPNLDLDAGIIPTEVLDKIKVTMEDFTEAHKGIQPTAMREVWTEVPEVRWEDVGGLDDVKQKLMEAVEWPIKNPEFFDRMGIRPTKGILLYGPPGTGKTLLAKAIATESEANFISVRGPEVLSKWVGESEKAVRQIFQKARQAAPCIIFFDELDSIAPPRGTRMGDSGATDRIVNQLLTELDGTVLLKNVVVIGATNRPDLLDPALLRPGRFDQIIYAPPPDEEARLAIFRVHTRRMPLAGDVSLEKLASLTEGYTGADIEALCREAAMSVAREDIESSEVKMSHFDEALTVVPSSLTKERTNKFESIVQNFKTMIA